MGLVEHHIVTGGELPPYTAFLYDYLIAGNGVFLRSQREGLSVILPVKVCEIRGLTPIEPVVHFAYRPIPAALTQYILDQALSAHDEDGRPVEILFHLEWKQDHWNCEIPAQVQTATSVIPIDDGPNSSYARAIIELHSHHEMRAFFSSTDDRDEQGFRIYAVLGRINTRPELLVRVGCEGVHWIIPTTQIFDLPEGIVDASAVTPYDEEEIDHE